MSRQFRQDRAQHKITGQPNGTMGDCTKSAKECTNHVSFAMEDVYIDGYTPYVPGIPDADTIYTAMISGTP